MKNQNPQQIVYNVPPPSRREAEEVRKKKQKKEDEERQGGFWSLCVSIWDDCRLGCFVVQPCLSVMSFLTSSSSSSVLLSLGRREMEKMSLKNICQNIVCISLSSL